MARKAQEVNVDNSLSPRDRIKSLLSEIRQDKVRSNAAISTGSLFLDLMIDPVFPGLRTGCVSTVVGLEGSGKTSLALNAARALIKANENLSEAEKAEVIYFDVENGLKDAQLLLYGLTKYNTPGFNYKVLNDGNQILSKLEEIIVAYQGSSNVVFVVVDSVPHLSYIDESEQVKNYAKSVVVSEGPNKLKEFFKRNKARLANTNIHIMFMTFLTNNIAATHPGAEKFNVSGGSFLRYGSDIMFELKPQGKPRKLEWKPPSEEGGMKPLRTGEVEPKNFQDVMLSFRKQKFSSKKDILYTLCMVNDPENGLKAGIMDLSLLVDFATKQGIIKQSGAWFEYKETKVQGSNALKEVFKEAAHVASLNKDKEYDHPHKNYHISLYEEVRAKIKEIHKVRV